MSLSHALYNNTTKPVGTSTQQRPIACYATKVHQDDARLYSLWEHSDALDQVLIGVSVIRHHLSRRVEEQKTSAFIAPRRLREVHEKTMLVSTAPKRTSQDYSVKGNTNRRETHT